MQITHTQSFLAKLNHRAFVILLLIVCGFVAFLSQRYNYYSDWTYAKNNSLSETSKELLLSLTKVPTFTIYASETGPAREVITEAVKQYQQLRADIKIQYINPELEPDLMRELNINSSNALQVTMNGTSEFIPLLNEQEITNAIQRLARSEDRWLVFIDGHGERKPDGVANHDLGEWGKQLTSKGIRYQQLQLAESPVIPSNVAALVIASPQVNYLPGEIEAIKNYLAKGGNLLWLIEPDASANLTSLADFLGLELPTGTVHDQFTLAQRINDPRFVIVTNHPRLSTNDSFQKTTLFPYAQAIIIRSSDAWQSMPILSSSPQSWIALPGAPLTVPAEKQAFDIGVALVRDVEIPAVVTNGKSKVITKQRILVIGDGDFISNRYQGNAGNLDLGLRLANWLMHDDQFIAIPARTEPDIKLEFSNAAKIIIGFGFLIVLPLLLAATGARIWVVRRRR